MARKGLALGTGKGYRNIIGRDPSVHSQSARGVKQPQRININGYLKDSSDNKYYTIHYPQKSSPIITSSKELFEVNNEKDIPLLLHKDNKFYKIENHFFGNKRVEITKRQYETESIKNKEKRLWLSFNERLKTFLSDKHDMLATDRTDRINTFKDSRGNFELAKKLENHYYKIHPNNSSSWIGGASAGASAGAGA